MVHSENTRREDAAAADENGRLEFDPDSLDSDSANSGMDMKPDVPGSDEEVRAGMRARREALQDRREDIAAHDYAFPQKSAVAAAEAGSESKVDRPVGKRGVTVADIVKLVGLLAAFVLMGAVVAAMWPVLSGISEEGGLDALVKAVQQAGALGVVMLLGLQLLQVIVAFIPGEVVQVAAGMMYGPWWGGLIVAVGACLASALVYLLVHWLGAPFVRSMASDSFMSKFRSFEASGRLDTVVFILFLIPGMPKDVFTYLVALTDMKLAPFLLLSTLGRIPGIFVSTYTASSMANGDMTQGIVIFIVVAIIAVIGILMRDRIIERLEKMKERGSH